MMLLTSWTLRPEEGEQGALRMSDDGFKKRDMQKNQIQFLKWKFHGKVFPRLCLPLPDFLEL